MNKGVSPYTKDYRVENHGSLFLLCPLNELALGNLLREMKGTEAQWMRTYLAVEPRYIGPLVEQLREEGWVVG
jgi:hypothetical protein